MTSKSKDIGKWFEEQCEPHLKKLCSRRGRMFYPFPDSRGSRGTVSAQPGEYMLLIGGKAVLLELKATKKHKTFRSCMAAMVRDSQYGWHKKWHLSGNPSYFIFYSDITKDIQVWNGKDIVKARSDKKPLEKHGYSYISEDVSIETAMVLLVKYLELNTNFT